MAVNIVPQTLKPKPMNTRKTERRIKQRDKAIPQQKCEMGRPISAPPFKRNVKEVNLSHETKFFTY